MGSRNFHSHTFQQLQSSSLSTFYLDEIRSTFQSRDTNAGNHCHCRIPKMIASRPFRIFCWSYSLPQCLMMAVFIQLILIHSICESLQQWLSKANILGRHQCKKSIIQQAMMKWAVEIFDVFIIVEDFMLKNSHTFQQLQSSSLSTFYGSITLIRSQFSAFVLGSFLLNQVCQVHLVCCFLHACSCIYVDLTWAGAHLHTYKLRRVSLCVVLLKRNHPKNFDFTQIY